VATVGRHRSGLFLGAGAGQRKTESYGQQDLRARVHFTDPLHVNLFTAPSARPPRNKPQEYAPHDTRKTPTRACGRRRLVVPVGEATAALGNPEKGAGHSAARGSRREPRLHRPVLKA
jgi:hypothetical protein